MNYDEFIALMDSGIVPENIHPLLQALLLDASGDWDAAHRIAQEDPSRDGSWVHAYLHRKEGDLWNANYWYRRADRTMPDVRLEEEWDDISRTITGR